VRARQVRRVYEQGRPFRGTRVVVWLAPGTGGFTAVAGRRVGAAVERNRARRVLRAAWRQVAPQLDSDHDAVVVARTSLGGAKTQDLVTEMTDVLGSEITRP
jgi:ribonuclease P protein component